MKPPIVTAAGRSFEVAEGTRLHVALAAGGVPVETPCGARGYCRKCRVRYLTEPPPPAPSDLEQLTEQEVSFGYRLSCQHAVTTDCTVAVVPSLVPDVKKAAMGRLAGPIEPDPWVALPPGRALGLALDIGTTTVVGALLDLRSGEELAALSVANPQSVHGADLMSRLSYALQAPEHPNELRGLLIGAVNQMVDRLCARARARTDEVVCASVCGNSAMHHLFLGLSVEDLAVAPYVPTTREPLETPAAGLGLRLGLGAVVYTLPLIAGFVGADAVAAGLAAGIDQGEGTSLVVDIGTNGEMLLRHRGQVYACSAPAGPAFEGGEIYQGMRAGPGAIERVDFDGADLQVGVIRGAEVRGICGSGLLDAVAALLAGGVLDPMGRMRPEGPLAGRVHDGPHGRTVRLLEDVVLTQKDVRQLQLAKGAIRSGIDLLMRETGAEPETILLAGAFGNYLRRESAIAIGLLPPGPVDRVVPVGNAAAMGAKLALLTRSGRERAERLARSALHVELATHPLFEEIFLDALNFPARG
jgi:uncharacterized 2Fe-2S/4Fe-4S cluster protein (DUF4445 family)